MQKIGLVGLGAKNWIFGKDARDNCGHPWLELKKRFYAQGYDLVTKDLLNEETEFDIHVNARPSVREKKDFLIAIEPPQIWRENYSPDLLAKYKAVFTWNDAVVGKKNFLKLHYPNPVSLYSGKANHDEFDRDIFACMIAGNKSVKPDGKELYSERLKVIRWYEKMHPESFSLYGIGWDAPAARSGWLGKVSNRLMKHTIARLNIPFFKSYQGPLDSKSSVLSRARFGYAYENAKELPGYITEKIFDCFFSGCIPIYWGANNITEYVPKDCFIDRRQFDSQQDLHDYLCGLDEDQLHQFKISINQYLNSNEIIPFSSEYFASDVVQSILARL